MLCEQEGGAGKQTVCACVWCARAGMRAHSLHTESRHLPKGFTVAVRLSTSGACATALSRGDAVCASSDPADDFSCLSADAPVASDPDDPFVAAFAGPSDDASAAIGAACFLSTVTPEAAML